MNPTNNIPNFQYFRACVGGVITNGRNEALSFERRDIPEAWQMPQGGMEQGEEPLGAVIREILEETGIKEDDLEFVQEYPDYLTYEIPMEYRTRKTGRGQTQKWFLFKYIKDVTEIHLPKEGEFISWKWMTFNEIINQVVPFKKIVYQKILMEFAGSGL